jgi:hypothetical protein
MLGHEHHFLDPEGIACFHAPRHLAKKIGVTHKQIRASITQGHGKETRVALNPTSAIKNHRKTINPFATPSRIPPDRPTNS